MEGIILSLNQILINIDNFHHQVIDDRNNFAKEMDHTKKLLCLMQKEKNEEWATKVETSFTPSASENETKGPKSSTIDGKNLGLQKNWLMVRPGG